jgi:hypothetical protein
MPYKVKDLATGADLDLPNFLEYTGAWMGTHRDGLLVRIIPGPVVKRGESLLVGVTFAPDGEETALFEDLFDAEVFIDRAISFGGCPREQFEPYPI